ncbi:MAG: RNA polymerase sigma-70 factor, ECF subfamily [Candidatus Ozemobacter sibiricus]|jgi:RNA polymerase sigma-70 factor (ECF subfamily)|uniref:RNA polymerase sigma-70 factor, ECF subfamily n=1 Tax=Candidatus Ozemobacter sibiricus TaxID=2268124 RepID=A0A367ZJ25_9BACT|nr:MAG: RNA polymerase sigma-70 factor, ECF subfamily [Candidatus Ozemobacter sibiricus]
MEAPARSSPPPSGPSDADLVRRALEGARDGYAGLVDRHLPSLVGFLRYLNAPPPLVDDLVQETFTKAFKHLRDYDPRRPFTTWLFSIGKNTFYDHCRKHHREQKMLEAHPPAPDTSFEGVEEGVVKRRTLEELLASLNEQERMLIQLRIYQDLPFAEIAQIMGDSEGALRVRFHRILKTLRAAASKEGNHAA